MCSPLSNEYHPNKYVLLGKTYCPAGRVVFSLVVKTNL